MVKTSFFGENLSILGVTQARVLIIKFMRKICHWGGSKINENFSKGRSQNRKQWFSKVRSQNRKQRFRVPAPTTHAICKGDSSALDNNFREVKFGIYQNFCFQIMLLHCARGP